MNGELRSLLRYLTPAVLLFLAFGAGPVCADWTAVGPSGGYFVAFAPHPDRPGTILAGGDDSSGIWKTTDGGRTWRLVSEELRNCTGWSLIRDRRDPDLLFAADIYGRHPVIRSVDGGETWDDVGNGMGIRRTGAVATDPGIPGLVYVGTGDPDYGPGNGVYRSADGGQTWRQSGLAGKVANHLAVLDDGTVIAGTPGGVFRSRDHGQTWKRVLTIPPLGTTAMATSSTGDRVWVAVPGPLNSLYRSDDRGSSWQGLGLPLRYIFTLAAGPPPADRQALLFGELFTPVGVHRSLDGGRTWADAEQGLDCQWIIGLGAAADGRLFSGNFANEGIYRSLDGGRSWRQANAGLKAFCATGIFADPNDPAVIYVTTLGPYAFGSAAGKPHVVPTRTQRGSIDPASGEVSWTVLPGITAQTYGLSVAPGDPDRILVGTFEQGFLISRDGGLTASPVVGRGTCVSTMFDPDDPNVALAAVVDFEAGISGLWRSADGGETWASEVASFGPAILIPEAGSDRIWATSSDGLYVSLDNGLTWNSSGLAGHEVTSFVSHPLDPAVLYVGTQDTGLFASVDGGGTWQPVPHPDWPVGAAVTSLVVDPLHPDALLVGLRGAELRSQAADVQRGGVWAMLSGGTEWRDLATPALHNDQVTGLLLKTERDDVPVIYAATYGAGVMRRELSTTAIQGAAQRAADASLGAEGRSGMLGAHPNPFNAHLTITFEMAGPGKAGLRVYDLEGRLVRTLLEGSLLSAGPQEAIWDGRDEADRPVPSGTYFYRLDTGRSRHIGRALLVK